MRVFHRSGVDYVSIFSSLLFGACAILDRFLTLDIGSKDMLTFEKSHVQQKCPPESICSLFHQVAMTYNNMGATCAEMEDYDKALEYSNKALAAKIQHLGMARSVTSIEYLVHADDPIHLF